MASGKGAGIAKSTILVLFKVPPISAAMEAGNPEIQGALEITLGKGAGIAKSTILVLLWCSPQFGGLEAGNPRNTRGLGNSGKERVLQNRRFWCFCGVPPISAALEARNPGTPTGLEMGSGKGAGIAKSTIFVLSWGSPSISAALEAGNSRNTRGLGNGLRKRSGYCKIDNLGAFCGVPPHVGGRGARDARDVGLLGTRRA